MQTNSTHTPEANRMRRKAFTPLTIVSMACSAPRECRWARQLRWSAAKTDTCCGWDLVILRQTGDRPASLRIYSIKDRKETTLAEDVRGYSMSDDGSKVLVAQGPTYNLYDATPVGDKSKKAVPTTGLMVDRVPAEEWNQIFNEVWRRYRMVSLKYARLRLGSDTRAYKTILHMGHALTEIRDQRMISEMTVNMRREGGDSRSATDSRRCTRCALRTRKASGRYSIARV